VARYGLDRQGNESGGGVISAPDKTDPGAHPAFHTMGTRSVLGVKRDVDHPPPI